jgi:hypothetical protein
LVLFINDPERIPSATWMYNPNLFEASTIVRMAGAYETLLRTVAVDPEVTFESLVEALNEFERAQCDGEQKEFQQVSLRKLKGIRRKPMNQR